MNDIYELGIIFLMLPQISMFQEDKYMYIQSDCNRRWFLIGSVLFVNSSHLTTNAFPVWLGLNEAV